MADQKTIFNFKEPMNIRPAVSKYTLLICMLMKIMAHWSSSYQFWSLYYCRSDYPNMVLHVLCTRIRNFNGSHFILHLPVKSQFILNEIKTVNWRQWINQPQEKEQHFFLKLFFVILSVQRTFYKEERQQFKVFRTTWSSRSIAGPGLEPCWSHWCVWY